MNIRRILWVLVPILFRITLAHAQATDNARALTEETLRVEASSATVQQWLSRIETGLGIVISYNPAQIDVDKVRRIDRPGVYTVGALLSKVLDGYKVRTAFVPPRKLLIQAEKIENVCLGGTVLEEESGERLYGAVVSIDNGGGRRTAAITDANGVYRLYVPPGTYVLNVSYMGYAPSSRRISVSGNCHIVTHLEPLPFEIEEITVETSKRDGELGETTPSSMLSFSRNDLFSQIWILPGVISSMAGSNLQVDGGSNDENLFLLDGVPVFHPGHLNSLLPIFNGDAVKNVVFHKGFFSTRFEGKLSSVTEVNLKDGNKNEFVNTLSLDMPAASVTLEGPIVKDKLSYMVAHGEAGSTSSTICGRKTTALTILPTTITPSCLIQSRRRHRSAPWPTVRATTITCRCMTARPARCSDGATTSANFRSTRRRESWATPHRSFTPDTPTARA